MLPNKFDQYFRDKLLDHSTKVSPGAWKMIHAGLLRHKAFHGWKWYVAGPCIVVVALTGHLILAQINKPVKAHAGPSTPASTTSPAAVTTTATATPSASTPAASTTAAGNPITSTAITPAASATPAGNPTAPAGIPAPNNTTPANATPAAITPAATNTRSLANANIRDATRIRHTINTRHATNTRPVPRPHTRHAPIPGSESTLLASDESPAEPATETQNQYSRQSHPTFTRRPSGPTAQPTIVRPAIRLAITAKTPNPASSKSLTLPSIPYQTTGRWRLDGSASPEYFSFKEFGFSYGAGARATFVFKQHYTITAGLQYLKVDVRARQKDDSLNSLFPGIFNNVQVPLLFGYTTGNQRYTVGINAGAIFSLYSEAKGRLKDYGWPNHNGITSYLGFNFATRVTDRISLFAEPYIKCWYPQKYQNLPPRLFSTGISLGLRFDLK